MLRGIFGGSEGVDEPVEGADGSVDLENPGRHGLRCVLLAVDEVSPRGNKAPTGFQILKAHFLPELCVCPELSRDNRREGDDRTDCPTLN